MPHQGVEAVQQLVRNKDYFLAPLEINGQFQMHLVDMGGFTMSFSLLVTITVTLTFPNSTKDFRSVANALAFHHLTRALK